MAAAADSVAHGHTHGGDPRGSDATDHERPYAGLRPPSCGPGIGPAPLRVRPRAVTAAAREPEGPERPPRSA